MGHGGLIGRDLPHHPEAVAGAFDVERHAGLALAVHHAHSQRLLELVVVGAHAAALAGPLHIGPLQLGGDGGRRCAARAAAGDDAVALFQVAADDRPVFAAWPEAPAHPLLREAAALTTQIKGETIPTDKPGALSMTLRQPVGVILSIVPWNGTVVLAARAIAYPIVCGNTVVFRGSEASPRTHALVEPT